MLSVPHAAPEQEEVLSRFVFGVRPKGLVVDDQPGALIESLQEWGEEDLGNLAPTFSNPYWGDLDRDFETEVEAADFLLIDNRWKRKTLRGFTGGLELAAHVVGKWGGRKPVFCYTAYGDDWSTPTGRRRGVVKRLEDQGVRLFAKDELGSAETRNRRLLEMVAAAMPTAIEQVRERPHLRRLYESEVVDAQERHYRLLSYDGRRRHQTLWALDVPSGGTLEVPTALLRRAGIGDSGLTVTMRIIQYSGGQTLSYFLSDSTNGDEIPMEVRRILNRRDTDE